MRRLDIVATGGCQCGAVRYRAAAMLDNAHVCHCRMCQKAVGNIFAALVAAPDDALEWTRGEPATFRSSEHVERGFCSRCGTPLFYHDLRSGRTNLTMGSLDRPGDFPPHEQEGIESRVPWFGTLSTLPEGGETEAGDQAAWAAAIKATNRQAPDHD